jgi:hypothetical protein
MTFPSLQVQAATEALIEKIQRPTQLQTPSIDFSKPRLVQITVTDVGACMPLQPMVRKIDIFLTGIFCIQCLDNNFGFEISVADIYIANFLNSLKSH